MPPDDLNRVDFTKDRDLSSLQAPGIFNEGMFPKASFWARAVAMIIDYILYQIILSLILAILKVTPEAARLSPALVLINLGLVLVVFCAPLYSSGQTLGKKIMKIKVVSIGDGRPLTLGQILLREYLGKSISAIFLFFGYLWALWDKEKQTWHDKIAKTQVVSIHSL